MGVAVVAVGRIVAGFQLGARMPGRCHGAMIIQTTLHEWSVGLTSRGGIECEQDLQPQPFMCKSCAYRESKLIIYRVQYIPYKYIHTAFSTPLEIEVVVAKTYEAYYDLLLQMNSGVMIRAPRQAEMPRNQGYGYLLTVMIHDSFQTLAKTAHLLNDPFPFPQTPRKKISLKLPKDYVVLCHGHVSPEQDLISAPLYWAEGTHLPTLVRSYGRPAQTRVKVLAHCYQQAGDLVEMKVRGVEKKRGSPLPTTTRYYRYQLV